MIAAFLSTRAGRVVAAICAGVLAVLTFGAWQRREGRRLAEQTQKDRDHEAVVRADRADSAYRADGAAKRLSDGRF